MPTSLAAHIARGMFRNGVLILVVLPILLASSSIWAQTTPSASEPPAASTGPVRLRQPGATDNVRRELNSTQPTQRSAVPYIPGDFERFVQRQAPGAIIRRFGADLVMSSAETPETESTPVVPPDYPVATGDEILVLIWGSVDADLRLVVDRAGRINIPRVGSIPVAGVRHADLHEAISRRIGQTFKNYQLSVSLGSLRGIRVFVTGFVVNPGAYQVTSLSTLTTALFRSGGPSAAGSFRNIELRRGSQLVGAFDLYEFILKGDRSGDKLLQAGDVIHVLPVATEVGLIGSVNRPAVLELKAGETVADALRMVGGFTAVADQSRLAVERVSDRNSTRIRELNLPGDLKATLDRGDLLRAFSAVDAILPIQRQNKRVRIEGEVGRPGDYVMPASSTIADALRSAGGLTTAAYVFGTEFTRESVRVTQQENYDRALRDLETEFARQGTQRSLTLEDATAASARGAATTKLIERLRGTRPSGRIVLQLTPTSNELPELALEDGDRIFVPARPTTVGVFGSVFNGGSYLFNSGRKLDDYLRLAGGPTKGADTDSVFLIRANGSVLSAAQDRTGFMNWQSGNFASVSAEAGDTIFVPEEVNKSTFIQSAKDWTQIIYQFGIGLAGLVTATR